MCMTMKDYKSTPNWAPTLKCFRVLIIGSNIGVGPIVAELKTDITVTCQLIGCISDLLLLEYKIKVCIA